MNAAVRAQGVDVTEVLGREQSLAAAGDWCGGGGAHEIRPFSLVRCLTAGTCTGRRVRSSRPLLPAARTDYCLL